MSHAEALEPFAVKSYRYLRWSIVVVVLSIIAAVLIEWVRADCFQGSISAYYYTPVQAVFVGGLVAIGVSLIAIKGSTDWEDVLLNLAGVLAPIVAFVPTTAPGQGCEAASLTSAANSELYIDNNVLAFAIGGLLALVLAAGIGRRMSNPALRKFERRSLVVLALGAAMLVAGVIWYAAFREHFLDYAHMGTAIAMFSVVAVVILLNAWRRKAKGKSWIVYLAIGAAMPLAGAALAGINWLVDEWDHFILWLELVELSAFGLYWVLQTFEHWDGGVPTGPEREPAAAS